LQGQSIAQKILPKSKHYAYIEYNNSFKSVIYYNAETHKILTSQNYMFLIEKEPTPQEEIVIRQSPTCEGERGEENTPAGDNNNMTESRTKNKQKQVDWESE